MTAPLARLLDAIEVDLVPDIPGRLVVPPHVRAVFLAGMARSLDRAVLAVVPGERDAEALADDVALFTDEAVLLPGWETLPFEHISPNVHTMARRARARWALRRRSPGAVVVASVRAATQRVSPSSIAPVTIEVGEDVDFEGLVVTLTEAGYHRTDRVEARGEIAVRGGLIDVFPADGGSPARIDFWGDTIDDIRAFSVATQRSTSELKTVTAYPARELRADAEVKQKAGTLVTSEPWASATWDRVAAGLSFQGMESWLPWLAPAESAIGEADGSLLVVFDETQATARSAELVREEAELAEALAGTWGADAPPAGEHPALYLALADMLSQRAYADAPAAAAGPHDDVLESSRLDAVPGDPSSIARAVNEWSHRGVAIVLAMDGKPAAERVAEVLAEAGLGLPVVPALDRAAPSVLASGIHRGFVAPSLGFGVVGEQEIAGRRRSHRRPRPAASAAVADGYRDLTPGAFVVHRHHGIGRFEGLVHREMAGVERDYLLIAYHGQDRLYVPTDQLAAVRTYVGGETPRLSRMGGADWETTRTKVRKAVEVVAEEVVALHRARASAAGRSSGPDSPWQGEFEASFPFEETPDQITAISDVKFDMEKPDPMDRLIFGDVGFGKTEVALRAAFKAIQAGRQVAVLVPTTLLAQQHFSRSRSGSRPIRSGWRS